MKILTGILLAFLSVISLFSQNSQTAKGLVYNDTNKNGKFDKGENGIKNVAVSNGKDIVQTDENGKYSIPVSNDAIIFVIKPGNYNYPLNSLNQPQFYYIHKPAGSPDLKYKGSAPTGKLPESIDLGLLPGSESNEFKILVFADPQPYSLEQVNYYEKDFVQELAGKVSDYAFGITLGDIVGDNLDLFDPVNTATSKIGLPWYNVIGNHDENNDVKSQNLADETYEKFYGPATFAFNQGKVHFIILDDIIFPNPYTEYKYVGGFTDEQFTFIENSLKYVPEDYLIVFSMHIPIFNESYRDETFLKSSKKRLFEILKDRKFTFSLSGHTHTQQQYYFNSTEGWQQETPHHHYNSGTVSGDWWTGSFNSNGVPDATMRDGTPNGYNIISFKGNTYSYEYKCAGMPSDYKMRLYGPKKVKKSSYRAGEFYVNFFQGSSKDTILYKINDTEWKPMTYSVESDPYICALRYMWDFSDILPTGARPSNPDLSTHLWRTSIPSKLPTGKATIYVKANDSWGRSYNSQFEFEVMDE